jgi:hypothetical protein
VAVLLGADLYEFSWRYQLPALVTLPVAGAFGVTALVRFFRARRQDRRAADADRTGTVEAAETLEAVEAPSAPGAVKSVEAVETLESVEAADQLAVAGSEQAAP